MKTKILNLYNLITTGVLTVLATKLMPVMAQAADNCTRIYGQGDICTERTPFVIGSLVIDDATMVVLMVSFFAVMAVVVNAVYLKSKVAKLALS